MVVIERTHNDKACGEYCPASDQQVRSLPPTSSELVGRAMRMQHLDPRKMVNDRHAERKGDKPNNGVTFWVAVR